jgi:hypothetical protein
MMKLSICLTLACVVLSSAALRAEELPLVFSDDFEKGAANWDPTDKSGWRVDETADGKVYSQFKKQSSYKPPQRSPYHRSYVKDVVVGDFELTARVKSTHKDYNHRDVCLFFGYQDPSHFYYVHLGKKTDDHANQIFIVNEAPRTKISLKTSSGTNWDDKWHIVKVVRKVADGTIEIYYDNLDTPVMIAKDKTFVWGQVGIGSFDDTAAWDRVELRGKSVTPVR